MTQALLFQTGPDGNYEPQNQTSVEGNDDQAFWGFAVMSAAEFGFPNPPPGDYQWLELAQAVFNRQAERWDTAHCDGGLRWQFNALNNGWMTKNSISNGCFFQLAARLARYTANDTYAYWANVTYDWMSSSPLMNADYSVFDSIGFTDTTCDTEAGQIQWTYNIGTMIAGCAYMYNYTQDTIWAQRLQGFLNHTQSVFFQAQYGGKTMVEYACEPLNTCNADQRSFKAYLARWLAAAIQLAPFTATQITPWLQTSALAAARVCTGSANDPSCGRKWYVPTNDGSQDVGNQLAAMSVVQSNLIYTVAPPYSAATGGNSTGDPGAGSGAPPPLPEVDRAPLTEADRAAAWFLTVLVMLAMVGFGWFLLSEKDLEDWYVARLHGEEIRHWIGLPNPLSLGLNQSTPPFLAATASGASELPTWRTLSLFFSTTLDRLVCTPRLRARRIIRRSGMQRVGR